MSDPANSAPIEDVLSSIRRLVAEESARPLREDDPQDMAAETSEPAPSNPVHPGDEAIILGPPPVSYPVEAAEEDTPPDTAEPVLEALVLTSDFRVNPEAEVGSQSEEPLVSDSSEGFDFFAAAQPEENADAQQNLAEDDDVPVVAHSDADDLSVDDWQAGVDAIPLVDPVIFGSSIPRDDAMEEAGEAIPDDTAAESAHDDWPQQVMDDPAATPPEDTLEEEAHTDAPAAAQPEWAAEGAPADPDFIEDAAAPDTDYYEDEHYHEPNVTFLDKHREAVFELHKIMARTDVDAEGAADTSVQNDEVDVDEADLAAEQTLPPELEEAMVEAVADDERLVTLDESVLDEEGLRELVSQLVREELKGSLGERITRNVRKLVRREIHRALAARDFE